MAAMQGRSTRVLLFLFPAPAALLLIGLAVASPPPEPLSCVSGTSDCTVTTTYGSFPDSTICRAANATFPQTEQELVATVAAAAASKRKVKVTPWHSHSFPKLACPGSRDGTIISTERLNRTVSIDVEKRRVMVESGVLLRDLIQVVGDAGMALRHSRFSRIFEDFEDLDMEMS